ncbi:MAG: glycosyltransferase family 9 protein [Desulfovibrio sp.]|nr:glycosyltransferase family 9 protein [Desulfovibrio sp.]
MNTLLINLTRFGDLLQSRAAIADLTLCGHRVALVCLENFAPAAELLPGTAHVAPLPSAALLSGLASEQGYPFPGYGQRPPPCKEWHKSLAALGTFRARLESAFPFERVCNLTPGIAAGLLTRYLAGTRPCSGFYVDEHGFGVNGNSWAAFFMGSCLERGLSPFNIADLFRKTAVGDLASGPGIASLHEPEKDVLDAVRERLRKEAPDDKCSFIALQLGASDDRRRWPVEYFAALGDIVRRRTGCLPLLLGSEAERPLAASYAAKAGHPHINLCGRTDLRELSAVLRLSELLVGNDTGTMHLAAGLGVPVLAVFLATAQPFDTGPYREDCCCLEPDLPCHPCRFGKNCPHGLQCRYALKPEFFASLIVSRLTEGRWVRPEDEAATGSAARIWVTGFDAQGFMDVHSLSGHENSSRAVRLTVLRRLIRAFLNDEDLDGEHDPALPRSAVNNLQDGEGAGLRAAKLLELLQQQAALALRQGGGAALARLPATWRKAHDALRSDPELAALALLFIQTTQCVQDSGAIRHELTGLVRSVERFSRLLNSYIRATARLT